MKGKDTYQIFAELERLDQIQYNIEETPKLNEKVIENKRKKLKETLYRILSLYKKEDQAKYDQLRRLEMSYEAKKVQLIKKYEAVNSAKEVNLEEIPLPFLPDEDNSNNLSNQDKQIKSSDSTQEQYILISGEIRTDLKPPGCPALVPPKIEDLEDELRSKGIDLETVNAEKDLDEFLKEVDQVEKQASIEQSNSAKETPITANPIIMPNLPPLPPMILKATKPPPVINPTSSTLPNPINSTPFPVLINPMGIMNAQQILKKPNMPQSSFKQAPHPTHLNKFNAIKNQTVAPKKELEKVQQTATIEAKPQLRNLSADVTKFLPTSLRINRKRQEPNKRIVKPNESIQRQSAYINSSNRTTTTDNQSKDTAYAEFMKELSGLI